MGKSLKMAAEMCAMPFTVNYADGSEEKIWIRTMTDYEVREAEEAQSREISAIRKSYEKGSVRYEGMLDVVSSQDTDSLAMLLLSSMTSKFAEAARKKSPALMPLVIHEHMDEVQCEEARAAYAVREAEHDRMVADAIDEARNAKETEIMAKPREDIINESLPILIRNAVTNETMRVMSDRKILYSIYDADDHNKRYFDSFEEVARIPDAVKDYLFAAIAEVDDIQPLDIKNSQGRSVMPNEPAENIQEPTKESSTTPLQASGSRRKSSPGGRKQS